jgi:integrase
VWRIGAGQGDTKTKTSRRTLALPQLAVTALQALHADSAPGPGDLVFCTASGQPLDAANVRRFFRAVCTDAGIGPGWRPQELRHTFVQPHVRQPRRSKVTEPSTGTSSGPS